MAYPQNARTPVSDRYWIGGNNSLISPTDLAPNTYAWTENCTNRGGVIQTRPGKRHMFSLPGTRGQGLALYRPFREKEQLVWAIDGQIFYSEYPFITRHKISNLQFYQHSPQVYFCQARQGVKQNPDGSLTLLPQPIDILFCQDGFTASGFYIGTSSTLPLQAGHNKGAAPWFQCPVGTVMFYSGSRLWVAYQETIFASDLDNPNSFTERTYLAESDGFKLPEPCTGMLETQSGPGNTAYALLCFSPFTATSIQSSILDRPMWQQTPDFQTIVSKDYGNVAPFGCVTQFAMPWMFSEIGFMSLNAAFNQFRSSTVNPQDMEMLRSKNNISDAFRHGICSVSFENVLLISVPSGSRWNRHTWVMDGAPQSQLSTQAPPCWVGIWTGTYPIQYAAGEIQDVPRCFELSYSCQPVPDEQGHPCHIHLWENFMGRRTDLVDYTDTPISCSFETKVFEISQVGELSRFKYCEIDVIELLGTVALQVYYAGIKGHYRLAYQLILQAEEGSPGSPEYSVWDSDTVFESFKPQTRTVKTPEFSGSAAENDDCADTCGIESNYQHNIDKGFQLLFNWQGRMGIREVRLFVEPYAQPGIGQCTSTEAGEVNIVSAIGCLPSPNVCLIPVP